MKSIKKSNILLLIIINFSVTLLLLLLFLIIPTKETNANDLITYDSGNYTAVVGSIQSYSVNDVPSGYLLCNGQAISRTTYSDLFAVIGTTYGIGNGTTTFNIPNAKGNVIVNIQNSDTNFNALGKTGGSKTHALTEAEMPSHNHPPAGGTAFIVWGAPDANLYVGTGSTLIGGGSGASSGLRGGSQAHNNLQPYIVMNYIIKY